MGLISHPEKAHIHTPAPLFSSSSLRIWPSTRQEKSRHSQILMALRGRSGGVRYIPLAHCVCGTAVLCSSPGVHSINMNAHAKICDLTWPDWSWLNQRWDDSFVHVIMSIWSETQFSKQLLRGFRTILSIPRATFLFDPKICQTQIQFKDMGIN